MSMRYLAVANPDPTPSCVSGASLVKEVRRRWSEARVDLPSNGSFSVRCSSGRFTVKLYRDGCGIALEGELREVQEMVIAFRRPLGKDLTFTDEGYYGSVVGEGDGVLLRRKALSSRPGRFARRPVRGRCRLRDLGARYHRTKRAFSDDGNARSVEVTVSMTADELATTYTDIVARSRS